MNYFTLLKVLCRKPLLKFQPRQFISSHKGVYVARLQLLYIYIFPHSSGVSTSVRRWKRRTVRSWSSASSNRPGRTRGWPARRTRRRLWPWSRGNWLRISHHAGLKWRRWRGRCGSLWVWQSVGVVVGVGVVVVGGTDSVLTYLPPKQNLMIFIAM